MPSILSRLSNNIGGIFMSKIELINNIFDYSISKTTLKYLGLTHRETANRIFDYSSPKMTLKYLGIDKEI